MRVAAVAVLVLAAAAPVRAGLPTDQLKGSIQTVIQIIQDPALKTESRLAERRDKLRTIADQIFDFGEIARRALARHWLPLSEPQRKEFVSLFSDLLERSYVSRIEQYGGEKIVYASERVDGETATVTTRIVTKNGTEVPVDYRMTRRGDRWLVYDVNIEGVSLVSNYRTQFNKIIQTESYTELVRRLKSKQEVGAETEPPGKKAAPAR
jgi:phospholipid transport system substrate-binding protein